MTRLRRHHFCPDQILLCRIKLRILTHLVQILPQCCCSYPSFFPQLVCHHQKVPSPYLIFSSSLSKSIRGPFHGHWVFIFTKHDVLCWDRFITNLNMINSTPLVKPMNRFLNYRIKNANAINIMSKFYTETKRPHVAHIW